VGAEHPIHTAEQVLERLPGIPGGPELLDRARRREDVALVGGAVRDLLLGHWPRELDVTVAEDAAGLARDIADSVSPGERAYGRRVEPVLHERFGTASVAWGYGHVDIAERRAESYPAPGALPEVRPGSFEEDLRRRDFTVNAIALPLHGAENEGLISVDGALDDLRAGVLRVLHERSFLDDPTRVLRLARYSARLGFEIEPGTRDLARQAMAEGALDTVSGGRIGAELWLAVREADGRGALRELDSLGVLSALGMPAPFDDALAQEAAALLPADGAREVMLMGVALRNATPRAEDRGAAFALMERLEFTREQAAAVDAASWPDGLAKLLLAANPAAAHIALEAHSLEAAALAGTLAGRESEPAHETVRDWLQTQRHVKLEIDGHDLIAAGVPEGPEIGIRLHRALGAKREGRASGREQELQAALEADVVSGEAGPE
jgi:tRNA nucleotidyltransferase (CCA-adding enzyme)